MDDETRIMLQQLYDYEGEYNREIVFNTLLDDVRKRSNDKWRAYLNGSVSSDEKKRHEIDNALRRMSAEMNGHASKASDEESRKAPPAPHYEYY